MRTQLFIGGDWVDASSGEVFAVFDPSTGDVIGDVASGTAADATLAADAAATAQVSWAATAPRERSEILRSCWEILMGSSDELADLIVARARQAARRCEG